MTSGRFRKTFAVCIALSALLPISASAESKARIVRLSEVEGIVQIDRTAGDGFDKAFINLPVIEGSKLKTGKDGRAEVEFEDGSALRLAPDSEIAFTRLALGDNGEKFTAVQLVSGTLYANLHPKKAGDKSAENTGDQFELNFADESITVTQTAHFRAELHSVPNNVPVGATLAVFKGKISANGPSGQFEIAEKRGATLNFAKEDSAKTNVATSESTNAQAAAADAKSDAAGKDTFAIAKNYQAEASDDWDRQQSDYHDRYALAANSGASSPYGYGLSDLNYYGGFMNVAGYGDVWQPYFIGANWSPFQDGGWAYYPGGYAFVSGYPWGWAPYHSGNWVFIPGFGWVWEPGAYMNSYYAMPQVVNAPVKTKLPTAPVSGRLTVMVGRGLAANPPLGTANRLTITPESAGFGIPRGSVNHLDHLARTVNRTSRPVTVSTAPPPSLTQAPVGFGAGPSHTSGQMNSTGMTASPHKSAAPAPRSH